MLLYSSSNLLDFGFHLYIYSFSMVNKKIALPPQTKHRRGGGLRHCRQVLYWSIFKKSRHLGFGFFIDVWSMHPAHPCVCLYSIFFACTGTAVIGKTTTANWAATQKMTTSPRRRIRRRHPPPSP
jgi:hypothetical protein